MGHPLWNEDRRFANDFLILKLKWASQLYADQIVALDTPDDGFELSVGDQLVTMGLGQYSMDEPYYPNVLQETSLQYVSNDNCRTADIGSYSPDEIICARGDGEICYVSVVFPSLRVLYCIRTFTFAF